MTTAEIALLISGGAALVGLYGATNAHRALRWQRTRDADRRSLRVHIEVEHAIVSADPGPGLRYRLTVAVVNDSEESAVFVRDLEVGERDWVWSSDLLYEEPDIKLEPGARVVRHLDLDPHQVGGLREALGARARLTNGVIVDRVDRLDAELIDFMLNVTD